MFIIKISKYYWLHKSVRYSIEIALDIKYDIFRKRNITFNTRNSSGSEIRNIKTDYYGLETIAYLDNINIFKFLELSMQFV